MQDLQELDKNVAAGLGENFIELGNFRLGAIDDTHFSISHCDRASVSVERERDVGVSEN